MPPKTTVAAKYSVLRLLDEAACNYDPTATIDNPEWCEYADAGYDRDGNCLADADGDGVCDEFEVAGCRTRLRVTTTRMYR